MPIQVRYASGDTLLDEVREMNGPLTEWTVDLPAGRWQVLLDPDDWLLDRERRANLFPDLMRLAVFPNPSRGGFALTADLVGDGPEHVVLSVFDVQGRRVSARDYGWLGPGPIRFEWNGDSADRPLNPGVYAARVRAGESVVTRRLVVLP